jgi:hypothetical protein
MVMSEERCCFIYFSVAVLAPRRLPHSTAFSSEKHLLSNTYDGTAGFLYLKISRTFEVTIGNDEEKNAENKIIEPGTWQERTKATTIKQQHCFP